ncbi:ATP synthase delta chain (EC [Bathymodiolus thermophilus thioautotrophic gill symbiont]|uniref:ATP synthase delta chain (EC) n=3 Tax=sulfur-oxidizing symbionts TaxID=32036 RepID=A0ACA8ZPC0_9GAMM|nr:MULTISPECIES: F0F1 ATP synthase subunit delta [sulfur-oxidizing symbionts]CAC9506068.1 ATP synthase delta chain (EC 3.6.3.14) [uncultured Gammaproteobacteria bacterium]CAB5498658.1 ATP synthase delta chain (EC [Bathymodiolus azoricus thioautotrophic gill symbiont]CAB5508375.1 ATP synthase delta chain (EC [Bathymodiolus thermophilus thioautotrophic gill symbiont]CAC9506572.1 ATP synthase delta chain (EC 3.6.3.14) [uncultured Gammaproteobacteria bacterium]CAC9514589.1 ATP synthase delta chain
MELTTIAKPYANAVFEIAQHNKSHAHWRGVLEVGASVANDATMRAFVASPNSTKANKAKTIVTIFTSALDRALSKQEKTFIGLLLENDRINALPSILELFDAMSNLSSDAKAFHVISAYKLNKKEEDQIVKDLSDKYKTTISIDTEIDEDLVGGVVIKEGDKVIDLSIKARVNELGSRLSVAH